MSVVTPPPTPKPPSYYFERAKQGDETWLEDAIADYLGLTVTDAQQRICRALVNNENLLVVTANGLGKSYILAAITNVWLLCLYPAVAFATSGTEKKMRRTYCRPVENLHDNARIALPGTYKKQPDRIDFKEDPEQYFEASSPKDAGELEGVHAAYTLAIIEEADKDEVDDAVVDSMESLLSDERDRIIAIANPPDDEVNIVYELMNDPTWTTINLSSFDSHNVQVELGEVDAEMIDGIATVHKIKKDWRRFNRTEWPGIETARNSGDNPALDERWYKRRLGQIPPATASAHRPFTTDHVEAGFEREPRATTATPQAIALDVARSAGDYNALVAVFGDSLRILDHWNGMDHVENEAHVRDLIETGWGCPFPIDAIGEGSALADRISTWYPNTIRYKANSFPEDPRNYKNSYSEGMDILGSRLETDLAYDDMRLREELLAAARSVEYEETYVSKFDAEVFDLESKDEIKETLERSPDILDAAYMAAHTAGEVPTAQSVPATW